MVFRSWLLALTAACVCLAAVPVPAGWDVVFADDFEKGDSGAWDLATPQDGTSWRIEAEGGGHVFSGAGHSRARLARAGWSDYYIKADIKLLKGRFQLLFRMKNCENYFVVLESDRVMLTKSQPCGQYPNLQTHRASYSPDKWYRIEVLVTGSRIIVFVDGAAVLNVDDPNPVAFGTISLDSVNDTAVRVDNVEIRAPQAPGDLSWVKTGGPTGGKGYDVRMRPDDPDTLYVTDTFSGVNFSGDGGRNWRSSNAGIVTRAGSSGDAVPVFCLTIDPSNPDVLWAGTQNTRGIYRSGDGGKTWVAKHNGVVEKNGISFRGITVHPYDSNTVYAMGEISSSLWAGEGRRGLQHELVMGVVYKTTDGGQNWKPIWRGNDLARYLLIDPRRPDVMYVSTGIFDREPANSDAPRDFPGGVGILKTTDGGTTWRELNQANGLESLCIGSLFMHPQEPDILLAAAGNDSYLRGSGVFLSTDAGETWRRVLSRVLGSNPRDTYYCTSVEFATSNPRIAYAACGGILRSEDGGQTWKLMSGRPLQPDVAAPGTPIGIPIDLQVDPRNPDRFFVNNYGGGNFLTEDGGRTWTVASRGYTGAQVRRVSVDRGDWKRVYAAGAGYFRSLNGGEDWEGIAYRPATETTTNTIAASPANGELVLAADERQGAIFRSTNGGLEWQQVFKHPAMSVFGGPNGMQGFRSVVFAPSNPSVVYAGMARQRTDYPEYGQPLKVSFGVYRSEDGGLTWSEANDHHTVRENINVLVIDPRAEGLVYAATAGSGVLRTMDGGKSWQPLNQGLKALDVRALAINPRDWMILYAAVYAGAVYKSADAGARWSPSSAGMDPQAEIQDIVVDPANPSVVYAADLRTGVYRSEDGGRLWSPISRGLSTRSVLSLAISADGGTLYAATDGEGVFRLDLKPFDR